MEEILDEVASQFCRWKAYGTDSAIVADRIWTDYCLKRSWLYSVGFQE